MNISTDDYNELALYVVATPIGNLNDLTTRAGSVLSDATLIAAEDTRQTRKLLAHIGSKARLIAAHAHNERSSAETVINTLSDGGRCALVSDAGTPAISDPGARLVHAVRDAGFRVIPIPGASAPICLLSVAGIDADRFGPAADTFYFAGFLPNRSAGRITALRKLQALDTSVVILESPHRIEAAIESIVTIFGAERHIVLGRELTKKFEQIVAMPAGELFTWIQSEPNHQRGEFVIIIAPPIRSLATKSDSEISNSTPVAIQTQVGDLLKLLNQSMSPSQASKLAKRLTGLEQSELYRLAIDSENAAEPPSGKRRRG